MRRLLALGLLLPFVSIGCVAGVDGPCSDNPCDDGDFCTTDVCTVDDTTSSGFTCTNEAVDCEDEFCNPEDGECVECLNNDECDNGNFCDGTEVCAQNTCIDGPDPCDTATETCDEENDECIGAEDPCDDIVCSNGETCVDGECVADDPCADIVCSNGETCVDGECIADDPCADVTCDEGESCVDGECVPDMTGGDATAGEAFYAANCAGCHGADASGGVGPNIQGFTAAELQAGVEGAAVHNSITIAADDYANLEAFLATF